MANSRAVAPLTVVRRDRGGGLFPARGRLSWLGDGAGRCGDAALGRADAFRAADDGDEETRVEQSLGHPPGIVEGHGVDKGRTALDIVDAEFVELHLYQLARNPVRGVEAQRERPLEIGFRLRELLLGRSFRGQPANLLLDDVDGLTGGVRAGRGAAEQQRGIIEPDQAVRNPVGEATLLAYLAIEARRERAAAEDMVDDVGGHEVAIIAGNPRAAEIHRSEE